MKVKTIETIPNTRRNESNTQQTPAPILDKLRNRSKLIFDKRMTTSNTTIVVLILHPDRVS